MLHGCLEFVRCALNISDTDSFCARHDWAYQYHTIRYLPEFKCESVELYDVKENA